MPKEARSGRCIERQVAQFACQSRAIETRMNVYFEEVMRVSRRIGYSNGRGGRVRRMFDINKFLYQLRIICIQVCKTKSKLV